MRGLVEHGLALSAASSGVMESARGTSVFLGQALRQELRADKVRVPHLALYERTAKRIGYRHDFIEALVYFAETYMSSNATSTPSHEGCQSVRLT